MHLPIRPGDREILACGPVDWLGFNYYQPTRVMAPERDVDEFGNPLFAQDYQWPGAVMNKSRGWEIFPKGIYDFAMKMTRDYPELEWFVSENGIGIEEDRLLAEQLDSHLFQPLSHVGDGCPGPHSLGVSEGLGSRISGRRGRCPTLASGR